MYTYEDMLKMLSDISPSSVGETVLKFLEQFIYYYPEQWYQWKKYTNINISTTSSIMVKKSTPFISLKPAFGKIQ